MPDAVQLQPRRLPLIQNHLDNVARQQRQPQHTADVVLVDLLGVSDLANGGVVAALQHVAPAKCIGDCLYHGVVDVTADQGGADTASRASTSLPLDAIRSIVQGNSRDNPCSTRPYRNGIAILGRERSGGRWCILCNA